MATRKWNPPTRARLILRRLTKWIPLLGWRWFLFWNWPWYFYHWWRFQRGMDRFWKDAIHRFSKEITSTEPRCTGIQSKVKPWRNN